jgi:hypothetical protein
MGGSSFELIMQEVFNQKQRMDDLLADNRELRRQLTDLRAGRGILLEIQGKLFALDGTPADDYPLQVASTVEESPDIYQPTVAMPVSEADMGTALIMGTIPETPLPTSTEFEPIPYYLDQMEEQEEEPPRKPTSFLEEMLIDEFASAATSPIAVWNGPGAKTTTRKLNMDEEQKAVLRKELIGSFILE